MNPVSSPAYNKIGEREMVNLTLKNKSDSNDLKAFLNIRRYLFPPFILTLRATDLENALKNYGYIRQNKARTSSRQWMKEDSILSKVHTGFGRNITLN